MRNIKRLVRGPLPGLVALPVLLLMTGCQSSQECCEVSSETPAAMTATTTPPPTAPSAPTTVAAAPVTPPASTAAGAMPPPPVRIKAGSSEPFNDSDGNVWLAERGFADGDTVDRSDLQITNTATPAIYRTERYSMTAFSYPVPNGKYTVKLHFCETFEGITAPGERVFTFNVEGKEFKNFDVFAKAGGPLRAYIETVNVEVTDGKLDISFTPEVENPEINGIEILPAS